jgi:hypothetical protein
LERARKSSWEDCISPLKRVGEWRQKARVYFQQKSGGKTILALKRVAPAGITFVIGVAVLLAWLGPKVDYTYYRVTSTAQKQTLHDAAAKPSISASVAALFGHGQKQQEAEKRKEADEKRRKVAIRYLAPQVLGSNSKGPKAIRSGSKLIGRLLRPVDTRAQSLVTVGLPQGGEASGIVIDPGSTLIGTYSYSGNGDKVYFTFSRIDSPDGDSRRISAQALDASDYTSGVPGEEFTGNGVKVASTIGLTMFSGMTNTLTDRESLGNTFNGVQAKPSMKNALLQGLSQASQDQASRTASSIGQEKDYVIIQEGKEMIIELSEDFGK